MPSEDKIAEEVLDGIDADEKYRKEWDKALATGKKWLLVADRTAAARLEARMNSHRRGTGKAVK